LQNDKKNSRLVKKEPGGKGCQKINSAERAKKKDITRNRLRLL
jgi:hypothetical protein